MTTPTRVGQRVADVYAGTRGWVTALTAHGDAIVDWDDKPVGDEDALFLVDALRVIDVIRLDANVYADPALSPRVSSAWSGNGHTTTYLFHDGTYVRTLQAARERLIELATGSGA